MQQAGMTVITTTTSMAEAEIVAGMLEASGLTAVVDADDAGRTNPEFDLTRFVRVMVKDEDAKRAADLIREAKATGLAMPDAPEVDSEP